MVAGLLLQCLAHRSRFKAAVPFLTLTQHETVARGGLESAKSAHLNDSLGQELITDTESMHCTSH